MENPSKTETRTTDDPDYMPGEAEYLDEGRVTMGREVPIGESSRTASGAEPSMASSGGAQIVGGEEDRGFQDGPGPQIMSAETLTGNDVVNSAGEDLGDIEAIMVDVERGHVAYAVLSFGGFLGVGGKLFAIPWSALTLDADKKCFILEVDKQRLENAPGFDEDNWPSMADMQWASTVHSYYGTRPYWET